MKVVISGYYGFDNIGDEAILKSIIASLKKEKTDIEITVLSNNPKHTEKNYNVKSVNRWNLPNIYKELLNSDGLISGGGSLLQDITSSRSIVYYTSIMGLAKLAKKPIFIYAQGVGPINKKVNRSITKHFLDKVDYISLRDEDSANLVKSIGVNKNIEVVPDPVMGLDIPYIEPVIRNKSYIIVSVRKWNNADKGYLKNIAIACDNIVKQGIDVLLLPMHGNLDEETSRELSMLMNQKVEILSSNMNMEEKLKYIKSAKLIIAMRLHALIFAGTVNTPMIGISYDPKIDSYLNLVKQPCIGNVYDYINPQEIIDKALYMIENYHEIRLNLIESTKALKSTAKLTANKAINTFKYK